MGVRWEWEIKWTCMEGEIVDVKISQIEGCECGGRFCKSV